MHTPRHNSGFTLVETIVTLFAVSSIMTVIASVFITGLNLQRRALNIQQVEENASFLLESMAKEIRVSTISGPDNAGCTATTLQVTHPVNGAVVYGLSGTSLQRTVNGFVTTVSSNTVQFERLNFCLFGTGSGDSRQPQVTVLARIKSTKTKEQAVIDIQTTITQRTLID